MAKKKITYKSTVDTPQMHVLLSDISILDSALEQRRLQIMRKMPNFKVVLVLEQKIVLIENYPKKNGTP